MSFTPEMLDKFRKDFKEAVKVLETKYAVDISLGNITYETNKFKATMSARKKGLDVAEWNWYCSQYGFKQDDLGKSFIYKRKKYTITGLNRSSKFSIKAVSEDGSEFGFTPASIKELGNLL